MSRDDWYRRTTWTERDQEEFFARLKRSRSSFHKAQYLRIQAHVLQQAGLNEQSLELLRGYSDPHQAAMALSTRGDALFALGRIDDAIEAHRHAFEYERAHSPNYFGNSWLRFGETAIGEDRRERFQEVSAIFECALKAGYRATFPYEQFTYFACQALILSARGEVAEARSMADRAVAAAQRSHSGFGRHPSIGLVASDWRRSKLGSKLQRLLSH
jgi:tetratricopeptide (TPR) repeat protein